MASDLGLHCLSMSHKKDALLIWINLCTGSNQSNSVSTGTSFFFFFPFFLIISSKIGASFTEFVKSI